MGELNIIILAAGKGTRMQSDEPKVIQKTAAGPMISVITQVASSLNPKTFYIVTGYKQDRVKEVVTTTVSHLLEKIHFIHQEQQLGTGHAVKVAAENALFDGSPENTLILYGDTPRITTTLLSEFVQFHSMHKADVSLISALIDEPSTYGRIVRNNNGEIVKIIEAKDCNAEQHGIREVNSGIYLVKTALLKALLPQIGNSNAQNEFYLTDLISLAKQANCVIQGYIAPSLEALQGVNDLSDLALVDDLFYKEKIVTLRQSGVRLLDPNSTFIEHSVQIGKGSVIGPNVQLRGNTTIGNNVTIEGTAYIDNTVIGDHCHLKLGIRIEEAVIASKVSIGPFAHIRPETNIADNVRIGNFVEVKKSTLAQGAKVNHLSYIGDATVGFETNIGAGTITCNYDGFKKSKTIIGNQVFVGSNSSLVAPVTIEDNVTIGAGSVITKNVEAGALTLTRPEQRVVPGWSEKRRNARKSD